MDKNLSNFIFYRLEFSAILILYFEGKFPVIKLSVSIFRQTVAGYRIYTVSREPIRLSKIHWKTSFEKKPCFLCVGE